jgi:hypothetical protein
MTSLFKQWAAEKYNPDFLDVDYDEFIEQTILEMRKQFINGLQERGGQK